MYCVCTTYTSQFIFSNFTSSFTLCLSSIIPYNLMFTVCTIIKNTWKEWRHVRTQSTTLLSSFFYIYNSLVAYLYHFLTVYIGLGTGVVALDTDFSGTKILQVGVFPHCLRISSAFGKAIVYFPCIFWQPTWIPFQHLGLNLHVKTDYPKTITMSTD